MLQYTVRTQPFKKGGAMSFACQLDDNGQPLAIPADARVACALRTDGGHLVASCNVTVEDQTANPGQFTLAVADTSGFPTGTVVYMTVVFLIDDLLYASVSLVIPIVS